MRGKGRKRVKWCVKKKNIPLRGCLSACQTAEMLESNVNENVKTKVDLVPWMSQKEYSQSFFPEDPPRVFPYTHAAAGTHHAMFPLVLFAKIQSALLYIS